VRDPERIDRILAALRLAWRNHPDMRLGQLYVNLTGTVSGVWNFEDDALEGRLDEFLATGKFGEVAKGG
jgi:hypothetical protein